MKTWKIPKGVNGEKVFHTIRSSYCPFGKQHFSLSSHCVFLWFQSCYSIHGGEAADRIGLHDLTVTSHEPLNITKSLSLKKKKRMAEFCNNENYIFELFCLTSYISLAQYVQLLPFLYLSQFIF